MMTVDDEVFSAKQIDLLMTTPENPTRYSAHQRDQGQWFDSQQQVIYVAYKVIMALGLHNIVIKGKRHKNELMHELKRAKTTCAGCPSLVRALLFQRKISTIWNCFGNIKWYCDIETVVEE